jgi:hypothetical protein
MADAASPEMFATLLPMVVRGVIALAGSGLGRGFGKHGKRDQRERTFAGKDLRTG